MSSLTRQDGPQDTQNRSGEVENRPSRNISFLDSAHDISGLRRSFLELEEAFFPQESRSIPSDFDTNLLEVNMLRELFDLKSPRLNSQIKEKNSAEVEQRRGERTKTEESVDQKKPSSTVLMGQTHYCTSYRKTLATESCNWNSKGKGRRSNYYASWKSGWRGGVEQAKEIPDTNLYRDLSLYQRSDDQIISLRRIQKLGPSCECILWEHFSYFGEVSAVVVLPVRKSWPAKKMSSLGFLAFSNKEAADRAKEYGPVHVIRGHGIDVKAFFRPPAQEGQ